MMKMTDDTLIRMLASVGMSVVHCPDERVDKVKIVQQGGGLCSYGETIYNAMLGMGMNWLSVRE